MARLEGAAENRACCTASRGKLRREVTSAARPPILEISRRDAGGAGGPAHVLWTAERLRRWGTRSMLSLMDQGLISVAGFGLNVFLARWLRAEAYGAFAVAFAGFLFVSGFHNVLLLEPLTVLGPAQHSRRLPEYFREQAAIHALLVGSLSVLTLTVGIGLWRVNPQNWLGGAVVGSALALPFLLLLWLVRRMCYVLQRPSSAVLGSSLYAGYVFCGLFVLHALHRISPLSAFLVMGSGSLLAAWALWRVLGLERRSDAERERHSLQRTWRENWRYGRWLVGSTALSSAANQTQMFVVAGALGLSAAGVLRAMQVPALMLMQVLAATGLLILPAFSYDVGKGMEVRMWQKAKLVSWALLIGMATLSLLLLPISGTAEHLLYGGKYAAYSWLMALLALVPAAIGASLGHAMALRASQQPRFDLVANAIAAPVGVVSAFLLTRWLGLAGAAASLTFSYTTYSLVTCWIFSARRTSFLSQKRAA